ncbi:MAG TPA: hypothetical protein VFQ05_11875, partial [Candidatus Eisenbacteria bacterium]|nr:hypothetical protein [Candidatus Eisenbacteria bacterium]
MMPKPQLGGQAVLKRAPHAFDAAFRLRAGGGDEPHAEVLEHGAELSRRLPTRQLFLERPMGVVADQGCAAITVELERDPVGGDQLVEDGDEAVQVFVRAEVQGQDLSGRIVHGPDQVPVSGVVEPVERATVDQDQRPASRGAFAAPVMAGRAAAPLGSELEPLALAAHAGGADRPPLFTHQLGQVMVVDFHRSGQQLVDPLSRRLGQPAGRRSSTVAMNQPSCPMGPKPRPQPLELPDTDRQGLSSLSVADPS